MADLCYRKRTLLPGAELDGLVQTVVGMVDDPDELTRQEAAGLRDFLAGA